MIDIAEECVTSAKPEYGNGQSGPRMGKGKQGPDKSMGNKGQLLQDKERGAPVLVREMGRCTCPARKHIRCTLVPARKETMCTFSVESENVHVYQQEK
jgi:hypothetical protein